MPPSTEVLLARPAPDWESNNLELSAAIDAIRELAAVRTKQKVQQRKFSFYLPIKTCFHGPQNTLLLPTRNMAQPSTSFSDSHGPLPRRPNPVL